MLKPRHASWTAGARYNFYTVAGRPWVGTAVGLCKGSLSWHAC